VVAPIKAGEAFTTENLWVKRPGTGAIPAERYEEVLGKTARRDIPTDTAAGKRTLAVRIGDRATRGLYVALVVGAHLLLPFLALFGRPAGAIALGTILLARTPIQRVLEGVSGRDLIPVLGETGRVQLVFGALLTLGLVLVR
jgi:1,4-dihydroxy-2-naphthoate octaprenyltransferase